MTKPPCSFRGGTLMQKKDERKRKVASTQLHNLVSLLAGKMLFQEETNEAVPEMPP
jgi:hypothetical protein